MKLSGQLLEESCSFGLAYVFYIFTVFLVISHFGFEGGTLVLIASVPGHCLSFTLKYILRKPTCGPRAVRNPR